MRIQTAYLAILGFVAPLICGTGCLEPVTPTPPVTVTDAADTTPVAEVPAEDASGPLPDEGSSDALLPPELIRLDYEDSDAEAGPVVYLLGENHPSVKTQVNLYNLLEELHSGGPVQAILVEGSNGPFDHAEFVDEFDSAMDTADPTPYWRRQLEWGRVAGYEAFALSHSAVDVYGVEDMVAKQRHSNAIVLGQAESLREINRRGAERAETAIAGLRGSGNQDDVAALSRQLARYRAAAGREQDAYRSLAAELGPYLELIVKALELEREARPLQKELEPALPLQQELRELIGDAGEIDPSDPRVQELMRKLQPYLPKFQRLNAIFDRIEPIKEDLVAAKESIEPLQDAVNEAQAQVKDEYFILANAIREAAEARGREFPEVQTFYRDEADRATKDPEESPSSIPARRQRDQAMVGNALAFMRERGKTSVVLLVGAVHLEDVAQLLVDEDVRVVGGPVVGTYEPVQPWEMKAWRLRQSPFRSIFTKTEEDLKEESQILYPSWREEQLAREETLERLRQLQPSFGDLIDGGAIHENVVPGKDLALYVGSSPIGRHAVFGEHVLDWGPVSDKPKNSYRAYGRERAGKLVDDLSNEETVFMYVYRTDSEPEQYRCRTPQGEFSPSRFDDGPPLTKEGKRPRRVVVFSEPDTKQEGNVAVSPLRRWIRQVRKNWRSGVGEGPVAVYYTINARRAKKNMKILDGQSATYLGDVVYSEAGQLGQIPFTPQRGDHAQVVVIVAQNVAEFREEVARVAREGRTENKQFLLITCGNAFSQTEFLQEALLSHGTVTVCTLERQITPEAGERLREYIREAAKDLPAEQRALDPDDLMRRALELWEKARPGDPDLEAVKEYSTWALVRPVATGRNTC